MRCLTDAELHDVAAGESDAAATAHVSNCDHCRERLDVLRQALADLTRIANAVNLPPAAAARISDSIEHGHLVRGATSLRPATAAAFRWRPMLSALATAAALALIIFGMLPRFGAPTTLSASQVLGKSLQTLSNNTGIEFLEYELFIDGPTYGTWRIEQVIDHRQPTRYRVAAYSKDGVLQNAFSQDPDRGQRSELTRIDGRNYIVQVNGLPSLMPSTPQMVQALIEASISIMRDTSDPTLTVVTGATGTQYVIEIPAANGTPSAATMELQRARAVVNGADFRLQAFEATGTIFRQPLSVSYKLLRQRVRNPADVPATEFHIQPGDHDILLRGDPSNHPPGEFVTTIVRELAAARGF
jgi:hypothetical protein